MSRIVRRSVLAAALVLSPVFAIASSAGALGPAACPAGAPPSLAALATAPVFDPQDGTTLAGSASPDQAVDGEGLARAQERASFERILSERSAVTVPMPAHLQLSAAQRAEIEQDAIDVSRPKVGSAIDLARAIEFAGVNAAALTQGGAALHEGRVGRTPQGVLVWETALSSVDAKALRIEFTDLSLAPGVELYVYNEDGQVWGPYLQNGPDASGQFWSPSLFGDTARVHVRARDSAALVASRFTLARVMHLGARAGAVQDRIRERYAVGPMPDNIDYCGAPVPDCTQNGVCWIDANAGLAAPSDAIAHLQFIEGGTSYICTGSFLAQTGNAPQQPYFMTANHCFSTQASASSLEAFFKYRTAACNGTCPSLGEVPRVNGSTLLATGAWPTYADFTFVRLPGFPAGGARLLGWTTALVPETGVIAHMGHPAGSPLAFSFRRARHDNSSVPVATPWPEPTFLYSALASSSDDWAGATAGGSSGGPALLRGSDGSYVFVGQLTGAVGAQEPLNQCDPNATSTADGAFRSSFASVRRYLYDRIFTGGFESP